MLPDTNAGNAGAITQASVWLQYGDQRNERLDRRLNVHKRFMRFDLCHCRFAMNTFDTI